MDSRSSIEKDMKEGDYDGRRAEYWRQWTNLQLSASDQHKRELEFFNHLTSHLLKLEGIIREHAAENEQHKIKVRSAMKAVGVLVKREETQQEAMSSVIQALEDEREKHVCQICFSNPRNVLIMPCMHLLYCIECLQTHLQTRKTCPVCRTTINTWTSCLYG